MATSTLLDYKSKYIQSGPFKVANLLPDDSLVELLSASYYLFVKKLILIHCLS